MQDLLFLKATASVCLAGVLGLADMLAQDLTTVPALISDLGLPVAFLVVVCYALVTTNKALRASEAGRLQDRDGFMKQIREDSQRSEASRASLKESFDRQAAGFEKQSEALDRLVDKIDRMKS